jgi:hypothetical protein
MALAVPAAGPAPGALARSRRTRHPSIDDRLLAAAVSTPRSPRASVRLRAGARRARVLRATATRRRPAAPDATVDGIAEVKRVLASRSSRARCPADAFAAELARAYNQGNADAIVWNDDGARGGDLARLLQDLPQAEDLLDSARRRR